MLVWYRPQPNEVNFLPWIEGYLSASVYMAVP